MPVVELERRLPSREASEWQAYLRLCDSPEEEDEEPTYSMDDVFTQMRDFRRSQHG